MAAKCHHCGRWFVNKQGVRAHLARCEAWRTFIDELYVVIEAPDGTEITLSPTEARRLAENLSRAADDVELGAESGLSSGTDGE